VSEGLSYLLHLGVWAAPMLALQAAVLAWTGGSMRAALVPVAAVTAWLVAADHVAISAGVWHFDEAKILGLRIGAVPVEEVLFFLVTNALIAGGTILLDGLAGPGARR
jgi:lycopene cyclase domain-containing protein